MSRIVVVSVSGPEPDAETFSVQSVDITPRVPSAICASCGRKGTVAYVAFGSPPNEIRRYCRRCWPAAERAEEERAASYHRTRRQIIDDWRAASRRGEAKGPPVIPEYPPRQMGWHWSTSVRTLLWWFRLRWLEWEHRRDLTRS